MKKKRYIPPIFSTIILDDDELMDVSGTGDTQHWEGETPEEEEEQEEPDEGTGNAKLFFYNPSWD